MNTINLIGSTVINFSHCKYYATSNGFVMSVNFLSTMLREIKK